MTPNEEVKSTVDTLDYVLQWLGGMWEGLPLELKAFALTVFTISVLMQWIKKALLASKTKRERVSLLWASSLPLGVCLAMLGNYLSGGHIHVGYWAVIGLTSGSTAMGVHYVTMKVVLPLLRALWNRFTLAWRGHE